MKYLKKFLSVFVFFVVLIPFIDVYALSDKNLVNIYLFYSDSCMHCASEKEVLNDILDDYDNVKVYKYEVSNNSDNMKLLYEIADLLGVEVNGVPFTIVADKPYKGFNREQTKRVFLGTIDYYSFHGYNDLVGKYIGDIELPSYDIVDTGDFYDYLDNYGNFTISILGFNLNTLDLDLSLISVIIGFLDGISLYSTLILILLIFMFSNFKDKNKILTFGLIYIISSMLIYLLSILFLKKSLILLNIIKIVIGLMAICFGTVYLYSFIKSKNKVLRNNEKRHKIYLEILKFIKGKKTILSFCVVVIIALLINLVEFMSSNVYSYMFMEILSLNNLSMLEETIYLLLYVIFFVLDDFLLLFALIIIMNYVRKYKKNTVLSKGLCIIILLIIGFLSLFSLI